MDMKKTQSGRKHFSTSEKLQIIEECHEKGIKITCSKHGIYPSNSDYWKRQLLLRGGEVLEHANRKICCLVHSGNRRFGFNIEVV
jgi:transposase-like protein